MPKTDQGRGERVATIVRSLRLHARMTQDDLADACGMYRSRIVAAEQGLNQGSSHPFRVELARGLAMDKAAIDALFDGDVPAAISLRKVGVEAVSAEEAKRRRSKVNVAQKAA